MIIRAAFLFLLAAGGIYGLLWLATCTRYFRNKGRVRRVSKRSALIAAAIALAWVAMAAITIIDQSSN